MGALFAVLCVSYEGATYVGEMGADLMGAACDGCGFDEGKVVSKIKAAEKGLAKR